MRRLNGHDHARKTAREDHPLDASPILLDRLEDALSTVYGRVHEILLGILHFEVEGRGRVHYAVDSLDRFVETVLFFEVLDDHVFWRQ